MFGSYGVAGYRKSTAEVGASRKLRKLLGITLATVALFLAIASQASALTVGWVHPSLTVSEMPEVAHSLPPANVSNNDEIVAAVARNNVTIEANIGGGPSLPVEGTARNTFKAELKAEVERYGYGGVFWEQNPSLPYKPITAWRFGTSRTRMKKAN